MKKCFVIMPFGNDFDEYYSMVIRPTLTYQNIHCTRGDEIYKPGVIINNVYEAISEADFCIADVTDRNPNVNYELGMAHAIGKPAILITQRIEDVPFDYKHLRIIIYEPEKSGWENKFIESIKKAIAEVMANPKEHKVLNPKFVQSSQSEKDSIRKHIENIFFNQSYDLDRVNKIYLEAGNCTIKTSWKGIGSNIVYHLCHNIVCDLPGPIEIKKAYDILNARNMDYLVTVREPQHFTYYFFFKQFKNSGQTFDAETEVTAPGYLDLETLFESGEALMSTQALAGGFRYLKKEDWIYFPKQPEFSNIAGKYLSHPIPELIDTYVHLEESEHNYILKLNYQGTEPYQQETAAKILLK